MFSAKKKIRFLILLSIILFICLMMISSNDEKQPELSQREKLEILWKEEEEDQKEVSNILFWIKYWNLPSWYLGDDEAGAEMLKAANCPVTKCFFTHNRTYLPSTKDFDAILFHGAESNGPPPAERSLEQLYVYTVLESPFLCFEDLSRFQNFFNLTMTYRFDSDIHWHYGTLYDSVTKESVAPSLQPKWKEPEKGFYDEEMQNIISKKKKKLVWFASNCNSNSRREEFAAKLQEHVEVDIFGKCGTFSCEMRKDECDRLLTTDYMFYIASENALCKDYASEKLYRGLKQLVIPIIFSGADTSLFAPPKSYIDANDFDTIEDLVSHIKYLMNNPKAYMEYFWWKRHYYIINHEPIFKYGFCELCMKVRDKKFRKQKHLIGDIKEWWEKDVCAKKSHIEF